jgi:hypothetical protein
MENITPKYMEIYGTFTAAMDKGLATAQTAGETIVRLAGEYISVNVAVTAAYKVVSAKKRDMAATKDEAGKLMSAAAVDKAVDGSPEGHALKDIETHLENIDRLMSAVRHYQQGLSAEYNVAGRQ